MPAHPVARNTTSARQSQTVPDRQQTIPEAVDQDVVDATEQIVGERPKEEEKEHLEGTNHSPRDHKGEREVGEQERDVTETHLHDERTIMLIFQCTEAPHLTSRLRVTFPFYNLQLQNTP